MNSGFERMRRLAPTPSATTATSPSSPSSSEGMNRVPLSPALIHTPSSRLRSSVSSALSSLPSLRLPQTTGMPVNPRSVRTALTPLSPRSGSRYYPPGAPASPAAKFVDVETRCPAGANVL